MGKKIVPIPCMGGGAKKIYDDLCGESKKSKALKSLGSSDVAKVIKAIETIIAE